MRGFLWRMTPHIFEPLDFFFFIFARKRVPPIFARKERAFCTTGKFSRSGTFALNASHVCVCVFRNTFIDRTLTLVTTFESLPMARKKRKKRRTVTSQRLPVFDGWQSAAVKMSLLLSSIINGKERKSKFSSAVISSLFGINSIILFDRVSIIHVCSGELVERSPNGTQNQTAAKNDFSFFKCK